jgi:hypothetical protein
MLRIVNGEQDTLYRLLSQFAHVKESAEAMAKLGYQPIKTLDNSLNLAIYLNCVEPLGGFVFALKLPESVSRGGNVVLGESASNLLLASDKKNDTLKIAGYSLTDENLPEGYIRLLEIPLEVQAKISDNDFEILGADFSDGQGRKIDVDYSIRVESRRGEDDDEERGQTKSALQGALAYPNPFNSAWSPSGLLCPAQAAPWPKYMISLDVRSQP